MTKQIKVFADWNGMQQALQVGTLSSDLVRGKEIFAFDYTKQWLDSGNAQLLDPDLRLFTGSQYLSDEKPNFGMFLDSSPDRWGRVLMRRREAILARQQERAPATLHESDYLLGVFDGTRMGGLRFKTGFEGDYLAHSPVLAAPPWIRLRELENASRKLEAEDLSDTEELRWLTMLMAPGSSLGGARPKASVTDPHGNLWIAKFPSNSDEHDIGAWEMVTQQLSMEAGINVSPAQARRFSGNHHTYLTMRFDRAEGNNRIHFASAMTLLGLQDGADYKDGHSYLDLAGLLIQSGQNVTENLKELWTRMLFNILVSNTDDHLRNHGFLLGNNGWELSPAYDINPNPRGNGLTLNISEDDNSQDIGLAFSVAKHFRLNKNEAETILSRLQKTVAQWRDIARANGISRKEQEYMAPAFEKG